VASPLEISVVVSTYQRPRHLRRCLLSLAAQQDVAGQFEVIVVDDGSRDETADVVARFRGEVDFPVKFSTHPHDGFQLARCRNSGIRASVAPYLLFTDGDCIFPPDHLRRHLDARRPGLVRAGDCLRLDEATTERIDEEAVGSGRFLELIDARQQRSLRRTHIKSLGYQLVRHANRPKLIGWNMAVWREQLEQINGFDEQFRGWGCEDDDLAARLRLSGVRIATALGYTHGYHLWHPPHSTTPQRWHDGPNVAYFRRPVVLARCLEGIRSRSLAQVSVRVIGSDQRQRLSHELAAALRESAKGPEIEMLLWPCQPHFSAESACRVLVVPLDATIPSAVERSAHATLRIDVSQGAPAVLDALQRLLSGQHGNDVETARAA
jgi:glycosyltransferase involved in cell wall biosynthesis